MSSTNNHSQVVREASGCVFFAAMALYASTFIPSHPAQKLTNIVIATGLICVADELEKLHVADEAIAHQQRVIPCQEWLANSDDLNQQSEMIAHQQSIEGMAETLIANIDDLNRQPQSTAPAPIFQKIVNYLEGKDWKKDYEIKASIREFKDANIPLPEIQGYLQFLETQNLLETRSTQRGALEARTRQDKTS